MKCMETSKENLYKDPGAVRVNTSVEVSYSIEEEYVDHSKGIGILSQIHWIVS